MKEQVKQLEEILEILRKVGDIEYKSYTLSDSIQSLKRTTNSFKKWHLYASAYKFFEDHKEELGVLSIYYKEEFQKPRLRVNLIDKDSPREKKAIHHYSMNEASLATLNKAFKKPVEEIPTLLGSTSFNKGYSYYFESKDSYDRKVNSNKNYLLNIIYKYRLENGV